MWPNIQIVPLEHVCVYQNRFYYQVKLTRCMIIHAGKMGDINKKEFQEL